MIIELPTKCPLTAGGRSGDTLEAKGDGWSITATPRSYEIACPGLINVGHKDHVSSDARTNLQRGFEALRSFVSGAEK